MPMKFINIGFGNLVAAERVVALVSPESAPAKRLVQEAKEAGRVIDCSGGKKTRAILMTDSEHVILSSLETKTVSARLSGDNENDTSEDAV
ncbi:MAG: DUF370 domain-containing protein [Clostridia bacterium]|nr:DUF370 domain-containing protein [Clostridia bacterium]